MEIAAFFKGIYIRKLLPFHFEVTFKNSVVDSGAFIFVLLYFVFVWQEG